MTSDRLEVVELSAISERQMSSLAALTLPDIQYEYGGRFKSSIDECVSGDRGQIRGLAILVGDVPIGMVLLKRPPLSPDWASEDTITLHGLKIADRWQGKGYGRLSLIKTIAMAKEIWPPAKKLALTVDVENRAARKLYERCGLRDVGVPSRGRIGLEQRYEILL